MSQLQRTGLKNVGRVLLLNLKQGTALLVALWRQKAKWAAADNAAVRDSQVPGPGPSVCLRGAALAPGC
jgi:hypothetical protein